MSVNECDCLCDIVYVIVLCFARLTVVSTCFPLGQCRKDATKTTIQYNCISYFPPTIVQKCTDDHTTGYRKTCPFVHDLLKVHTQSETI